MKNKIIPTITLCLLTSLPAVLQAKEKSDEEPILKSVSAYYPNGEKRGDLRTLHLFDKKGNLTEFKRFYPNGSLQEVHQYTFNKKGRVTDAHHWIYRFGFKETMQKYEYNRKGEVIAIHNYENGAYLNQEHYMYKKNKPSLHYRHTPSGKLISKEEITHRLEGIQPLQIHPVERQSETIPEYYLP
ncbi:MAG: hypothetical protein MJZ14_07610 [Paludibacteraceae bacterium]|nr:hypothetical protein [Paludibacteraceae bacterium]